MDKKTIGILVCMLLIAAAVLPAVGIRNDYKSKNLNDSILQDALIMETEQSGSREDDYDWYVYNDNVCTGIGGGTYPSGFVGIGTSYPTTKLHIKSEDGTTAIRIEELTDTDSIWELRAHSYETFSIWGGESGSEKQWMSFRESEGIRTYDDIWLGGSLDFGAASIYKVDGYGEDLVIETEYPTGFRVDSGVEDAFHVTEYGAVGIGTSEPSVWFDVVGVGDIIAQFNGRVKGAEAVNNDEFVTKGQVKSVVTTHYTPTGTSDTSGAVGDTAWDDNYFYVKTPDGWKRAELETWETNSISTSTTLNTN